MLSWTTLVLWINRPVTLVFRPWPIGLAGVSATCSMIGFKLAFALGLRPAPGIDRVVPGVHERSAACPIRAVLTSIIIVLAADKVVEFWLFGSVWTGTTLAHMPSIPVLVEAAIQEEVLFRLFLLTGLLWVIEWLRNLKSPAPVTTFWAANIFQAVLFAAAYVAEGGAVIDWSPWPLQVVAAPQTVGGLVFGCVYRYYGVEASISSHALCNMLFPLIP